MAKKSNNKSFIRIFLKGILLIVNILFAFGLLLSFAAQYIKPSFSLLTAYCGLGFQYLLLINVVFVFLWLFLKYQFTLLSLVAILININNIDKLYQLRENETPTKCVNCVKVMTYNVKLFGLYDSEDKGIRDKNRCEILDFINTEQPDILCFQEYFYDKSGKLNFSTTDTILSILKLRSNKLYFQYFPFHRNEEYFYGYATFSKYRIINSGIVELPDSSRMIATYVDIRFRGDTIRIYNAHLASIHFDKNDYDTGWQFANNKMNDPKLNKKAKKIYDKISNAFILRQIESKTLGKHIAKSPHPVIVCGDLNDSPISYTYNQVKKRLKDSFRESGKGMETTYSGDVFPNFRIDYIFHNKRYNSYGHTVCTDITVSDHYPVYCHISLLKK